MVGRGAGSTSTPGPVGADGGWQPALPGIDPAPDLPAMDAVEVRGRLERRDGAVGVRAHSLREVAAPVAARSRDFR